MPTLAQTKKRIGFKALRQRARAKAKEVGFTKERMVGMQSKIEAARQKRREKHPLTPAAQRRKPPLMTPATKARVQAVKRGLPAAIAKRRAKGKLVPLRGVGRATAKKGSLKFLEALRKRAKV